MGEYFAEKVLVPYVGEFFEHIRQGRTSGFGSTTQNFWQKNRMEKRFKFLQEFFFLKSLLFKNHTTFFSNLRLFTRKYHRFVTLAEIEFTFSIFSLITH